MNISLKKILISLLVTIMVVACSHSEKSGFNPDNPLQKSIDQNEKFTVNQVKEKLSKLVAAAKSTGKEAVDYLSGDLYLKASAAQYAGDYATANLLYEYLVKLTDDSFVKTKYSISLIRVGDLEKSQKYLNDVYVASKKKNLKVGLVLAGVMTGLNKVKDARKIYREILKKDKKNEDACIFLSKSYLLEDKKTSARNTLERCEKHDRKNGVYSYYIGKIFIDSGKPIKAQQWFKRSLKRQKDFSRSALALGLIEEEKGNVKKAISTYKKFLKRKPQDKLILARLVQVLFTKEKFKEVIPYAERLTDLEPDNLNLKVKLGILYTDSKKYPEAIKVFKELLKAAPTSDKIMYYLGAIYQETKQYEPAIELFNKIPDTSALFQDSSLQIAHMLGALAKRKEASPEAGDRLYSFVEGKVSKIPGLKIEFSLIKASVYEHFGKISDAIETIEELREEKKFSNTHKYYLASLYEKDKKFDDAYEEIKSILKYNPNDAYALNFIGYSYIEREVDMDKAYNYISKAHELKPNDGFIMDSMGWYYYKKGDYDKSLKYLERAHKSVPNDTTISKHYAKLLKLNKKYAKAKKTLIKALKYTQVDKEKNEISKEIQELETLRVPAAMSKTKKK